MTRSGNQRFSARRFAGITVGAVLLVAFAGCELVNDLLGLEDDPVTQVSFAGTVGGTTVAGQFVLPEADGSFAASVVVIDGEGTTLNPASTAIWQNLDTSFTMTIEDVELSLSEGDPASTYTLVIEGAVNANDQVIGEVRATTGAETVTGGIGGGQGTDQDVVTGTYRGTVSVTGTYTYSGTSDVDGDGTFPYTGSGTFSYTDEPFTLSFTADSFSFTVDAFVLGDDNDPGIDDALIAFTQRISGTHEGGSNLTIVSAEQWDSDTGEWYDIEVSEFPDPTFNAELGTVTMAVPNQTFTFDTSGTEVIEVSPGVFADSTFTQSTDVSADAYELSASSVRFE